MRTGLFICLIQFAVFASAPAEINETILFRKGKENDGYNNIRIPAICLSSKGTLLAFAEGRVSGDSGKIHTILRRSTDGGNTWSSLQIAWQDGDNTCGNPCPIVDRDTGTIWLFLTWNLGADSEGEIMTGKSKYPRRVYLCKSTDDGRSWSKAIHMPHLRKSSWRWYATGPGNGIQLTRGAHRGRLICPANHSAKATEKRDVKTYRAHILYSDDHGETWQLGGIQEPMTNESTVTELIDGRLMQNMRSFHGRGGRAVAISNDGGQSFEKLLLADHLDSPVCQASILRYSWPEDDSSRILFSSPKGSQRSHMTIRLSYDEGKTWPKDLLIHDGGSAYSNLVKLPDDRVGLLYEKDDYQAIVFASLDLVEIEDK
ncbi:MAG TPA: exo-alpha-sialidase [Verrucomicrobia bacterium]|nr:exo-alpha-sialidase [Verrucomicrobiota bacterium]